MDRIFLLVGASFQLLSKTQAMLIGSAQTVLSSLGYELDCRSEAFGYLRDSSDLLSQPEQLRLRMQEDGYLYLRGLLNPQWVWQARFEIAAQLAAEGCLAGEHPTFYFSNRD